MIDLTITKDSIGGTQRRVTFTASAPGYIDATDGVDVAPQTYGSVSLSGLIGTVNTPTNTQLTVTWSASGFPASGTTYDLSYEVEGGNTGTLTGTSSGVVITTGFDGTFSGKLSLRVLHNGLTIAARDNWGPFAV